MKAMKIIACSMVLCTSALLSGMEQEKHQQKQSQNTQQTTQSNFWNSFNLYSTQKQPPTPTTITQHSLYPYNTQNLYSQPGISNQSNSHQPLLAQQPQSQQFLYPQSAKQQQQQQSLQEQQKQNKSQSSDEFELKSFSTAQKNLSVQTQSMALQKQKNETAKLKIMQDLDKQAYETLRSFDICSFDNERCQITLNLINSFNTQKYVTEDEMQKYAYEHTDTDFFDIYSRKTCVPVIFLLLKRYNQVSKQINAPTPLTPRQIENFKQAVAADKFIANAAKFNGDTKTQESHIQDKTIISHNMLQAYDDLEKKINTLLLRRNIPSFTIFTAFLNDQPQQEEKNFTSNHIPSERLPIEILEKIDRLCGNWDDKYYHFNIDNIFPILKLIETAKKDNIGNEDKLGREALARKAKWDNYTLSYYYSYDLKQKVISILCAFIKIYNQELRNKITPTSNEYHCYYMAALLGVRDLMPQEKAFNTEQSAYNEMMNLHNNIYSLQQLILKHTSSYSTDPIREIEGLVKEYYPNFSETESSQ